jgi:hypothetical protein
LKRLSSAKSEGAALMGLDIFRTDLPRRVGGQERLVEISAPIQISALLHVAFRFPVRNDIPHRFHAMRSDLGVCRQISSRLTASLLLPAEFA